MDEPGSPVIDPVRRLLSGCAAIAFCDPANAAPALCALLSDHYRVSPVASPSDPAAAAADLLVVASSPGTFAPPTSWPPAAWLQPGVDIGEIPGTVEVHAGGDLREAFISRFLSSCSG